MASRSQFEHEDVAAVPRGFHVRTISHPSGAKVRLAFPPGRRRKGTGQLVSILLPKGKNPAGLHLSLCTDPDFTRELNPQAISYLQSAQKHAKAGHIEKTTRALRKFVDKKKKEGAIKTRKPGFRYPGRINPENDNGAAARKLYTDFHGREPKEILTFHQRLLKAGDYTALGDDPELWLHPVKGDPNQWDDPEIQFTPEDRVMLVADDEGAQLYFIGERTKLPKQWLLDQGHDVAPRFVSLGVVYGISYTTQKSFDGFKTKVYAHEFGEEDGNRPQLAYDQETGTPLLIGGGYSIAGLDEGIGASPGIIN